MSSVSRRKDLHSSEMLSCIPPGVLRRFHVMRLCVQVIKEFCGQIGAEPKQAQQVIRLAKKNGEWLGFLAVRFPPLKPRAAVQNLYWPIVCSDAIAYKQPYHVGFGTALGVPAVRCSICGRDATFVTEHVFTSGAQRERCAQQECVCQSDVIAEELCCLCSKAGCASGTLQLSAYSSNPQHASLDQPSPCQ